MSTWNKKRKTCIKTWYARL